MSRGAAIHSKTLRNRSNAPRMLAPQNTGKAAMNRRRERTSIADAIADKTDREARHEREAAEAKRNAA